MTVTSEPGKGSVFTVRLPGGATPQPKPQTEKPERLRTSGARASVRTHKRGHWPNVRSWGEPDTPRWRSDVNDPKADIGRIKIPRCSDLMIAWNQCISAIL